MTLTTQQKIEQWDNEPGVSKVFWLRRNSWSGGNATISVMHDKHGLPVKSFCKDGFRQTMGRPFLRQGHKKPFRLITEERYQELIEKEYDFSGGERLIDTVERLKAKVEKAHNDVRFLRHALITVKGNSNRPVRAYITQTLKDLDTRKDKEAE